jgi:hypothetical protein
MDYGNMVGESFEYAKEAVMGKWLKWILLIIPFMPQGYAFQIFKGIRPAPEVNDWVANFINGIKMVIVGFIYAIPIFIVGGIFLLPLIFAAISGDTTAAAAGFMSALLGIFICVILGIIIAIILPIAFIRFARTESFGEAFNIKAIFSKIGTIGWGTYIITWIVLFVIMFVFGIVSTIIGIIPILGWIIDLFLMVFISIFVARYWTQLFDNA